VLPIAVLLWGILANDVAFAEGEATKSKKGATEEAKLTELVIYGAPLIAPLREVPQSTTVVTGELLAEKGDTSFQSEIESIPNLTWAAGTSRPRYFLIRGVGEDEQYDGAPNPSVATIIDGIDFSGLGLITPMFDIEQVEVLRGPQSVQFGSSALAGALHVRSAGPTSFTTGHVELMGGNDSLQAGGMAVGGAVPGSDGKLQLRFSAFNTESNGFRENLYLGRDNTNGRNESVVRLKARYEASSDLAFDFGVWGVNANNGYDAFAIDNSLQTQSDRPGEDDTRVFASSFKGTAAVARDVKLESLTTFARTRIDYSYDGDWGNDNLWHPYLPYDYFSDTNRTRKVIAEELRLFNDDGSYEHGESYRWLGGAFVQRLTEDTDTTEFSSNQQYDYLASEYLANTGAFFGQVETPLGYRTALVTGGRYEHRSTDYDDSTGSEFSPSFEMLGGALTLQHDINQGLRGYLTASRGYKGGGFNPGPSVPVDRRLYDPEFLYNFEAGLKGVFLKERLRTNVAYFYDLRRDQTLKRSYQVDPSDPLSYIYLSESVARGRGTGVELESSFDIQPWLTVFTAGSLMHSAFTDVPADSAELQSRSFAIAPNYQYSTGVRSQLSNGLFGRIEVTGRDTYYFDDGHNQQSAAYSLLNASLGYLSGSWKLTVWGRNLGNQSYAVRGFYFGNEPPDFPTKLYVQQGDPRAVGVTVSYLF
jgi:outer membrane receptor protein involved in Fe transport